MSDFDFNSNNSSTSLTPYRATVDLLPGYLRSDLLKKFFETTVDQWFQPTQQETVSGYIGKRSGIYYETNNDFYIEESTVERNNYQLEPTIVSVDNQNETNYVQFYQDIINSLKFDGALTNNHSRLFAQKYYSWSPPINVDAFINFSNYYWIQSGTQIIEIPDLISSHIAVEGQETYITEDDIKLSSGMRVKFINDLNVERQNKIYVVEGVGRSIQLIDDTDFVSSDLYDVPEYDTTPYDSISLTERPSYWVMERGAQDGNPWSYKNRWFHKDVIGTLNVNTDSIVQARRPIIEFNKNLELKNFARASRGSVTLVNIFDNVNDLIGLSEYQIDATPVKDNDLILFTNDSDPAQNNRIYRVFGILDYGSIGLELVRNGLKSDGSPEENEGVSVKKGNAFASKYLHYNGSTWVESQNKVTYNQAPIFNLYDADNVLLNDSGKYPNSTFTGSTLFNYQEFGNSVDQYLGIPIDFETFGDIVFDDQITTQRVFYELGGIQYEVGGYYFYKKYESLADLSLDSYRSDWHNQINESSQRVIDRFVIQKRINDDGFEEFKQVYQLSLPAEETEIRVFLNGTLVENLVDYSFVDENALTIKNGDIIEVEAIANRIESIGPNGFFEIPLNLSNNPNNVQVTTQTYNELNQHFSSIISNQAGFVGLSNGVNNYRDTKRDLGLGRYILNHSASLLRVSLLTGNEKTKLTTSIRYANSQYNIFKNNYIKSISTQFSNSDLNSDSDFETIRNSIMSKLNLGKTSNSPFYNSGMGAIDSFIPTTPQAIGITGIYKPELFLDKTRRTPKNVIRCHDGSLVDAFNDSRDLVILDIENYIFNNIDSIYSNVDYLPLYSQYDVKPGAFRTTDYSLAEWNKLNQAGFERWVVSNQIEYATNNSYDALDPFTWNYKNVVTANGEILSGTWRSLYNYYYDTDRPHSNPWEMLGFTQKPSWWDVTYGVAPYTSDNYNLWYDLSNGTIRDGARKGTDARFARPLLLSIIPVDHQGNLLHPVDSSVVLSKPNAIDAAESWSFGDVSPAEFNWRISASYNYDLSEALFFAKPAKFVDILWESKNLIEKNGQIFDSTIGKRSRSSDLTVHKQLLSDGSISTVRGISSWVSDYIVYNGIAINDSFAELQKYLDVKLGYRTASFIKKSDTRLVSDTFGIIPSENLLTKLYKSSSREQPVYSAVLVLWDGSYYRVIGYDKINQYFNILPGEENGKKTKITVDDVSISKYISYSSKVKKVPYLTSFATREEVFNFLIGYQRYLEHQGWIFDEFDTNNLLSTDFETSAKQYLRWTRTPLTKGSSIILSPLASKIKFSNKTGFVDSIQSIVNGVYSILDRTGFGILATDLDVTRTREDITINVKPDSVQGIYCLRLSIVDYEHIIIIDNTTRYGSSIYTPEIGSRQPRIRMLTARSKGWTGNPVAPGFIIQDDSLLDNFETSVDNIKNLYDNDSNPANTKFSSLAKHNFGYQERDYLTNLTLDDRSSFDLYKGYANKKGTSSAFEQMLRSSYVTETADFEFLEEWAFKIGRYGNVLNKTNIELALSQKEFVNSPQLVKFVTTATGNPNIIEITPNDARWTLKRSNITNNQFKLRGFVNNAREDLPTAGFVQLNETTYSIVKKSELETLFDTVVYTNKKIFNDGDTIWNIITDNGGWDVLRVCNDEKILSITKGIAPGDPTKIVFENDHSLVVGDYIMIQIESQTSPNIQGLHQVLGVTDTDEITIEKTISTNKTFTIGNGPRVSSLKTVRFASTSARNSFTPHAGWLVNDRAFIDNAGNWQVYTKTVGSWILNRSREDRINVEEIYNTFVYDNTTSIDIAKVDLLDPCQGYILSTADTEIAFKIDYDPAKYTDGDETLFKIDADQAWGDEYIGALWWDLSTTRFLDCAQGSYEYRRKNWSKLAPGISVKVLEWVKSPVIPANWDSYVFSQQSRGSNRASGTPYYGSDTPYVTRSIFNSAKNKSENIYYFWVVNANTVADGVIGRNHSAQAVANLISNPTNQNLSWMAPIATNAMIIGGIERIINDSSSVLQISFFEDESNSIIHDQWILQRENDSVINPDIILWNKMRDSLIGFDDLNNAVPDITLKEVEKYGNSIRPRQTWFKNRLAARLNFFKTVNSILIKNNITSIDQWDSKITEKDSQPTAIDYDYKVFSLVDRNALNGTIAVGKKVLVEFDESANNFWTLWQYAGSTNWTLLETQLYDVSNYWNRIDWYQVGYDELTIPKFTYETIQLRDNDFLNHNTDDIIEVTDNGSSGWSLYRCFVEENIRNYVLVAEQDATIQFTSSLSDYLVSDTAKDLQRSTVTKIIISALRTILLNNLEQNHVFFDAVRYAHQEHRIVPWVFKTSLVKGQGNPIILSQSVIKKKDLTEDVVNYYNEVKPYHTKIRTLSEQRNTPVDIATIEVTDTNNILIDLIYDTVTQFSNIPDNAKPKDYDLTKLSAADRVKLFYRPTEGMPPSVLSKIISRSEFAGTILDGKNFYQFGTQLGVGFDNQPYDESALGGYDYNAADLENFYDVFINGGDPLNQAATFAGPNSLVNTINVDGNEFIQPYLDDDHPEELVKLRTGDSLNLEVYTSDIRGFTDVGYDNYAYDNIDYDTTTADTPFSFIRAPRFKVKTFVGTSNGIAGPFTIGQTPQNKQAVQVYLNGTYLINGTDYTINWTDNTVTLSAPIYEVSTLIINSFGIGGSKILKRKTFKNSRDTSYDMGINISNDNGIIAVVNGEPATATATGSIVLISSLIPSNSTVFIAIFETNSYSLVRTESFTAISGDPSVWTLQYPATSTVPPYIGTHVYEDGKRLSAPICKLHSESVSILQYVIPGIFNDPDKIKVWRNQTLLVVNTDYLKFFVDAISIDTPGTGYSIGDALEFTGDGVGAVASVTTVGLGGEITSVSIINNGYNYRTKPTILVSSSGTGAVLSCTVNRTHIKPQYTPTPGTELFILCEQNADYTLAGANYEEVRLLSTNPGSIIDVTTYSEDKTQGLKIESFLGLTASEYELGKLPLDVGQIIVYVNGILAVFGKDYKLVDLDGTFDSQNDNYLISKNSISKLAVKFKANTHTVDDKVHIEYFTQQQDAGNVAYRIFKNIFGNYDFLRISDNNSTLLSEPLQTNDRNIYVEDSTVLSQPNPLAQKPGIVFINGERITYWSVNTTTPGRHILENCLRGTLGSGVNIDLPIGTVVRDGSDKQMIPGGLEWKVTPEGLIYDTVSQTRFLLEGQGTINFGT